MHLVDHSASSSNTSPFGLCNALLISISMMLLGFTAQMVDSEELTPESLRAYLQAQRSYREGSPVIITFGLDGPPDLDLRVLTWHTPLEGMFAPMFRIVWRGHGVIPYQGALAKRGDPSESEYVLLPASGHIGAEIDLTKGYDLTGLGTYDVDLETKLFDVVAPGEPWPRQRSRFHSVQLIADHLVIRIVPRH